MKKSPKDGPHKEMFAGGKVSGEGLRNGQRQGPWKFYHLNGKLKAVGKYVDGELQGPWEWWRELPRHISESCMESNNSRAWRTQQSRLSVEKTPPQLRK